MAIFFTIALIGFLYVVITSAFGHAADTAHDLAHDFSHGETGGHEPAHETSGHITSVFSARVIAAFFMGFGGVGGVSRFYEWNYPMSCLFGLGAGLVVGAAIWALLEFFEKQQANSLVSTKSLVGSVGTVTTPILGGRAGQVDLVAAGATQAFIARSNKGQDISKGCCVRVVGSVGSDLLVEAA